MAGSVRLAHVVIGAVIACALAAAACVQFASDALYAQADPQSLAAHVPIGFGLAVYGALDRIAPADYVEDGLARAALARGDLDAAQHYAVRMPAGGRRNDMLAAIATARGQTQLALEYDYVANDTDALQNDIAKLARTDVTAASALEARVRARLIALGTHPDAVAESYYTSGWLADWRRRPREAYADYRSALAIAPLNMKYVLSAANEAVALGDDDAARQLFHRGLDVNPVSGDATSGLGIVALRAGDRGKALAYLARARAIDPHAPMILELEKALR